MNASLDKIGEEKAELETKDQTDSIIDELKNQYNFLQYIHLKDTLYSGDDDVITVMNDINKVKALELGAALRDILISMYHLLDRNAGYFL